jgi:hypothetical protein
MNIATKLFLTAFPVMLMVALIPVVSNDYVLTLLYSIIIIFLLSRKSRPLLYVCIFVFGFFCMLFFEYIFISTGVETFIRTSLFGIMPLWLPFLWGYGFVAIADGVTILKKHTL